MRLEARTRLRDTEIIPFPSGVGCRPGVALWDYVRSERSYIPLATGVEVARRRCARGGLPRTGTMWYDEPLRSCQWKAAGAL